MAHASILGTFSFDDRYHGWLFDLGSQYAKLSFMLQANDSKGLDTRRKAVDRFNEYLSQHHIKLRFMYNEQSFSITEMTEFLTQLGQH